VVHPLKFCDHNKKTKTPIMNHTDNYENMVFLKKKIRQLKIALFKSEINTELKLPYNIVQILKTEDDGSVWFLTSCNGEQAKNIERSFYAYLDFYRKGTGCRLQLSGRATIVEDDNETFLTMSNYSPNISGRLVLIKMKIMQAEYFENKPSVEGTWKDRLWATLNQVFLYNPHKVYDFS
jgi:general stress protein 26